MGSDLKLSDEPFGTTEPEPQAFPRGVTIGHRLRDIGNARAMIHKDQTQATAAPAGESFKLYGPSPAMNNGIARQLTGGGDHLGLLHQGKALLDGPLPHDLPDVDNVRLGLEGCGLRLEDGHCDVLPALTRP